MIKPAPLQPLPSWAVASFNQEPAFTGLPHPDLGGLVWLHDIKSHVQDVASNANLLAARDAMPEDAEPPIHALARSLALRTQTGRTPIWSAERHLGDVNTILTEGAVLPTIRLATATALGALGGLPDAKTLRSAGSPGQLSRSFDGSRDDKPAHVEVFAQFKRRPAWERIKSLFQKEQTPNPYRLADIKVGLMGAWALQEVEMRVSAFATGTKQTRGQQITLKDQATSLAIVAAEGVDGEMYSYVYGRDGVSGDPEHDEGQHNHLPRDTRTLLSAQKTTFATYDYLPQKEQATVRDVLQGLIPSPAAK